MTCTQVLRSLQQVNPYKAPGPDGVSSIVLKSCAAELPAVYTGICNTLLAQAVVPCYFKYSVIVTVPRKSQTNCMNNFHPVALISVASNCRERPPTSLRPLTPISLPIALTDQWTTLWPLFSNLPWNTKTTPTPMHACSFWTTTEPLTMSSQLIWMPSWQTVGFSLPPLTGFSDRQTSGGECGKYGLNRANHQHRKPQGCCCLDFNWLSWVTAWANQKSQQVTFVRLGLEIVSAKFCEDWTKHLTCNNL